MKKEQEEQMIKVTCRFVTAQCYASAVLAMAQVRLSVSLSVRHKSVFY